MFNEGVHITEAEKRRGNRGSELQGMPEDELQETPDVELRGKPGSVRHAKPDAAPESGEAADASEHGRASLASVNARSLHSWILCVIVDERLV